MGKILDAVKPGVVTGTDLQFIFRLLKSRICYSRSECSGSSTVNAVMEAAKVANAPVMIQFSNGGAAFNAGKGLKLEGQQTAILGAIAGAKHYPHFSRSLRCTCNTTYRPCGKNLPWIDGLLDASEKKLCRNR